MSDFKQDFGKLDALAREWLELQEKVRATGIITREDRARHAFIQEQFSMYPFHRVDASKEQQKKKLIEGAS